MKKRTIKIATSNFENNGSGDPNKREKMTSLIKSLKLSMLLGQEKWDAADNGKKIQYWSDKTTGLQTIIGKRSCTAISFDPSVFCVDREWDPAPTWVLPPTAASFDVIAAGSRSVPLVAASLHLNYCMEALRPAEAGAATTYADRAHVTSNGRIIWLPAIAGGDTNSYPVPGTPGDPELPILEEIANLPHRVHRSYIGRDGLRVMDCRPDEILRIPFEDVARHMATLPKNPQLSAVRRTVDSCRTHGPDARIDRIYATKSLLPAVVKVEVIDVPPTLSDHHIVMASLDLGILCDLLQESEVERALDQDIDAASDRKAVS